MSVCKHCQADTTIVAADETVCPVCGMPFDLDDLLADSGGQDSAAPGDATLAFDADTESGELDLSGGPSDEGSTDLSADWDSSADAGDDADSRDMETLDSSALPGSVSDEASDAASDIGADTNPEPEPGPEFTHAFGGMFDDEDDSFEIALDEASDDEPHGVAGDEGATMAYEDPSDDASRDAKQGDDAPQRLDGGAPADATQAADGSEGGSSAGSSDDGSPYDATLAAGLSDSERDDSSRGDSSDPGRSDTHTEDATMQFDSGTMQLDSTGKSGGAPTPVPREISGLASDRTMPQGAMEGDRGSQSIQASDSQTIGPENVRLREFQLGDKTDGDAGDPNAAGPVDYRFLEGPFAGGMGIVHKARQSTLDRPVAIKQIRPDKATSETNRNMFVSEAVITGQLEHPNIVPVHDLGLGPDGRPFYSMKFVEGQDWDDCIKDNSEEENLSILINVAQAIAFAHSRNVIHMDLKPGNVRIGSFGEVQVMDFGLAARLDTGKEIKPGGTPMYMSPELALPFAERAIGKAGGRGGKRHAPPGTYSDIYLLGALLFKIVTGKAPHTGKSSFDCLRNAARNKIVTVRRKSELLDIAYKAMATDPEARYRTVGELIDAIKAYQAHAQSNLIARSASRDLRAADELAKQPDAEPNARYASFSRAQNGFQNALDLWPGNRKAKRRLRRAERQYAETAYANGDYDLALSLLDPENEEDNELKADVVKSQRARRTRDVWFKTLQYATAASLMLALCFIALSVVQGRDLISARIEISQAKTDKERFERQATRAQGEAAAAKDEAEQQTLIATQKADEAHRATEEAASASALAQRATEEADRALAETKTAKEAAALAVIEADAAKEKATAEGYNAAVGTLRATLNDSGAYAASQAMGALPAEVLARANRLNRREWVALKNLIDWRQEATELVPGRDNDSGARLAASADGARLAVATNTPGGARLALYDGDRFDAPLHTLSPAGRVDRVAVSADGALVATLGDRLEIWDARRGAPLRIDPADALGRGQTSLAFAPGSDRLLVGSDGATEVWRVDPAAGSATREGRDGQWHGATVTACGHSSDGAYWFSADDDGVVNVWLAGEERAGAWRYKHAEVAGGSPRITAAAMAGDGHDHRLVYGCDDGAVYELAGPWTRDGSADRPTGSAAWITDQPDRLPASHVGAVTSVAYANAGRLIVSTGGDTMLVRYPTDQIGESIKRERRYHDAAILACATGVHGGAPVAFTSDANGRVVRSQLDVSPDQIVIEPTDNRRAGGVADARFNAETGRVVVSDRRGYVRTWDDPQRPTRFERRFVGHDDHRDTRAWYVASPEPTIVTIAADHHACLWDPATGLLRRRIDLGGRAVATVTPSGGIIAATDRQPDDDNPAATAVWFAPSGGDARPLWDEHARVAALCVIDDPAAGPPTLAVGLRDGQVYLWTPGDGRVDLVRSAVRPHWRPIRSLAYDARRGVLYSGDNGGLVARWPLAGGAPLSEPVVERLVGGTDGPMRNAPVVRLDPSEDGRVLAIQRRADDTALRLLSGERLEPLATAGLNASPVVDACFDGVAGGLIAIGPGGALRTWNADRPGWALAPTPHPGSGDRLVGVRRGAEGRLVLFGSGVAQLWAGLPDSASRVARVASRSPAVLLSPDGASPLLRALSAEGRVDDWRQADEPTDQAYLPIDGRLVASCPGPTDRQTYLAIEDATDATTAIELWDLATRGRLRTVTAGLTGRCVRLAAAGDRLAAALTAGGATRVVRIDVGQPAETALATPAGRAVVDLALSPDGRQVVAVLDDGAALHARKLQARKLHTRQGDGAWRVATLDRDGVTAAVFTPDGDRLLVGVASGRVFALALREGAGEPGGLTTRTLLSFAGHTNRVTTLRFAGAGDRTTLVSGDAAGRVVVRPF